jgi:hypothetical protein
VVPPRGLSQYLHCATGCTQDASTQLRRWHSLASPQGEKTALRKLSSCGVVHLKEVFETSLVTEVARAWSASTKGSKSFGRGHLTRDYYLEKKARKTVWLPHMAPFNDTRLLEAPALRRLVQGYFDEGRTGASRGTAVVEYVTVVTTNPKKGKPEALHTSVRDPRRHLEVHVALT